MILINRTNIRRLVTLLISSCFAVSSVAWAQTPPGGLPFPSYADFGDPGDQFGSAISADGSWMVATGSNGEAFYVYERVASGWTRRQRIVPPTLGSTFIRTPLLRGNLLVISRPFDTTVNPSTSGTVYVYERINFASPFELRATLRPSDPQAGDRFGYGLGLASVPVAAGSATVLIVAASARDEGASLDQGVSYVFQRNESGSAWTQIQRITPTDATGNERFGQDLGVANVGSSVLLIVGAQRHQVSPTAQGAAYVYQWNSTQARFEQTQKIIEPGVPGSASTRFGYGIDAEGAHLLVQGLGWASEYTFEFNQGTRSYNPGVRLPNPIEGTPGGFLFSSVYGTALRGDRLVVTSESAVTFTPAFISGPDFATSYEFNSGVWQRRSVVQQTEYLSFAVEIANDQVLLGMPFADASPESLDQGTIQPLPFTPSGTIGATLARIWHGSGNVPDRLGTHVAVDGDWMAVSAPGADTTLGQDSGTVHLFSRNVNGTWDLHATSTGAHTRGICSLAMHGDTLVFGICAATVAGIANRGRVEIWKRPSPSSGSIVHLCDLDPTDPNATFFGRVVAISADTVLASRQIGITPDALLPRNGVDAFSVPVAACTSGQGLAPPPDLYSQDFSPAQAISGNRIALSLRIANNGSPGATAQLQIYERVGASWDLVQTLIGPAYNGSVVPYFAAPKLDGERMVAVAGVPIGSSIEISGEVWQYQRSAGIFSLQRALPIGSGNAFTDSALRGDVFLTSNETPSGNAELRVHDFATGAVTDSVTFPGRSLEDRSFLAIRMSDAGRAVVGWPDLDRDGVNNAGLVYTLEATARSANSPTSWTASALDSAPRPDRLFSHFFEDDP